MSTQIQKVAGLDKRYAYVYQQGGHPIRSAEQMLPDKPLSCKPPDDEWQRILNERSWWATGYTGNETGTPEEMELIKKLLSFGGFEACMAYKEPDVKPLLERGQLWYGDRIRMMPGEQSQCHRNSCGLWLANRNRFEVAVATGYALSKDGLWRQHSWMLLRGHRSVKVVETTQPRVAYYGYVMTTGEAEKFCYDND